MRIEGILDIGQWRRIFRKREALHPTFIPKTLPYRHEHIGSIAKQLAPVFFGELPPNIQICGSPGTGKTASILFLARQMTQRARLFAEEREKEENNRSDGSPNKPAPRFYLKEEGRSRHGARIFPSPYFTIVYINCQKINSPYRVLATITNAVCFTRTGKEPVPMSGLSVDAVYGRLIDSVAKWDGFLTLVLDEVDRLGDAGGDILYRLSRINEEIETPRVSSIVVTNLQKYLDSMDLRIRSSLGGERDYFPPYTSKELRTILASRADIAFEEGVCPEDVVNLCAALSADEQGDARRAIELLRLAGDHAQREGAARITVDHVRKAVDKMERDRYVNPIKGLGIHQRTLLFSIYKKAQTDRVNAFTSGEIYEVYRRVCRMLGNQPRGDRMLAKYIGVLADHGLIEANTRSYGRYGRGFEIQLLVPLDLAEKAFRDDPELSQYTISGIRTPRQDRF